MPGQRAIGLKIVETHDLKLGSDTNLNDPPLDVGSFRLQSKAPFTPTVKHV